MRQCYATWAHEIHKRKSQTYLQLIQWKTRVYYLQLNRTFLRGWSDCCCSSLRWQRWTMATLISWLMFIFSSLFYGCSCRAEKTVLSDLTTSRRKNAKNLSEIMLFVYRLLLILQVRRMCAVSVCLSWKTECHSQRNETLNKHVIALSFPSCQQKWWKEKRQKEEAMHRQEKARFNRQFFNGIVWYRVSSLAEISD